MKKVRGKEKYQVWLRGCDKTNIIKRTEIFKLFISWHVPFPRYAICLFVRFLGCSMSATIYFCIFTLASGKCFCEGVTGQRKKAWKYDERMNLTFFKNGKMKFGWWHLLVFSKARSRKISKRKQAEK